MLPEMDVVFNTSNTNGDILLNEYDGDYYDYYGDYGDWMNYGYPEDIAAQHINLYLPPVLLVCGTASNVLNVVVLSRLTSQMLTPCFYLAFLAVVDTLLLYIREGNTWIFQVLDINISQRIINRSTASCQVYSFVSNLLLHLSSCLLAAVLVEAAVISAHPQRAHKKLNIDRAKNVFLLQVLILICVNAHYFWTYGLESEYADPEIMFCTFSTLGNNYSAHFRDSVWPAMNMLASSVLPGVAMLICIIYILRVRKKRGGCTLLRNTFLLNPKATDRLVILCLVLGVTSLIFTFPEFCYDLFEVIIEATDLIKTMTHLRFHSQRSLAQVVCVSIRDLFLGFKILIYCSVWENFRKELRSLFCRKRSTSDHSMSREPLQAYDLNTGQSGCI